MFGFLIQIGSCYWTMDRCRELVQRESTQHALHLNICNAQYQLRYTIGAYRVYRFRIWQNMLARTLKTTILRIAPPLYYRENSPTCKLTPPHSKSLSCKRTKLSKNWYYWMVCECFMFNCRIKALQVEPYTQEEADRAAGMGSYVAPKTVDVQTQQDSNMQDDVG